MEARVRKWGNSLGIRIPSWLAKDIGLEENSAVELKVEAGRLIIQPKQTTYTLDELLSKVIKDNVHSAIDWEGPVGKEIW
jgi:antitoxin MazE